MLLGVTTTVSALVGIAIPFVSDHYVHCARCANSTNPCNGLYFINSNVIDGFGYGNGNGNGSSHGGGGGSAGTGTSYACPSFSSSNGTVGIDSKLSFEDAFGPDSWHSGGTGGTGGTGSMSLSSAAAAAAAAAAGVDLHACSFGPGTLNPGFGLCTLEESHTSWQNVFWVPVGLALFGSVCFLFAGSGDVQDWNSPSFRGLIHKASKAQWKTILSNA